MGVLDQLEPRPVFLYFEEITRIPHGSGNVKAISDYLAAFARARGYETVQDEAHNVIVTLPASPGREDLEPLILQGHMDMVAVREEDAETDLTRDALRLFVEDDRIGARGTSLGGDDGIAIAYFCALMDDPAIEHPALTLIATTDEETGMDGARALDPALLKAKRLINLDSEDEGVLLAGCAGGARVHIKLPLQTDKRTGCAMSIETTGLLGGHSGQEIIRERGNANLIIGRILQALIDADCRFGVFDLHGGVADNAIPAASELWLLLPEDDAENRQRIRDVLTETEKSIRTELGAKDPDFSLQIAGGERTIGPACLTDESARTAAALLMAVPNGVQAMSVDMPGLVETSLNLGVMRYDQGEDAVGGSGSPSLHLDFSVRSSRESARDLLIRKLTLLAEHFGAASETHGRYPGWLYDPDSPICAHFSAVFERMYGRKARVEAIHAGVECGLFKEKRPDLDCVSLGPDMEAIHSTKERLSVSSARRTWEYLLEALKTWDMQDDQQDS